MKFSLNPLRAHHISKHGATKVTTFELPIKVNLDAYRLAKQNDVSATLYHDMLMDKIDKVTDKE